MHNKNEMRTPLPAGTVLRTGDTRYTIDRAVGFGGTSLFYSAKKENSFLTYGIKECYPKALEDRLLRDNGVLTGIDGAEKALTYAREHFSVEKEISQKIARRSGRVIPVFDAPEFFIGKAESPAPAGSFLILQNIAETGMFLQQLIRQCALPPSEGRPDDGLCRLPISVTAKIIAGIVRALELIHDEGYLYGDLQPGNIFFSDAQPEQQNVGFCSLLDYGAARSLKYGKTAPITDQIVFTTPGFTAPEIFYKNDGNLTLTAAADIYSAGRMLVYLLKGRTFYENGRDRVLSEPSLSMLMPYEGAALGCTGDTLRLTNKILEHSLCMEPEDRYQTAAEMLNDLNELVRLTQPPRNHLTLSFSALDKDEFLGREDIIKKATAVLRQKRGPAVLWGFAGIGKTEAAIELAARWEKEYLGHAYFVRFNGSIRNTVTGPVADAFSGYSKVDAHGREKPEEQVYSEIMKMLGELSENDLLVIDNMDGDEPFEALWDEPAFKQLRALSARILVTTRSAVEDGIEVKSLPLPLLRRLMRRFVKLSDETTDALIEAVDCHTLTVELIARTLKTSIPKLSPDALLKKLRDGDLDSKVFASISTLKDRNGRMARIQGHLTALFHLADLPEDEKRLMRYALPISNSGLSAESFAQISAFDQDVLLSLIDRGWLRRSEDDILTLHPLVREIGWKELNPDIPALIRFAGCIIVIPMNYAIGEFDDLSIERGAEYLRTIYRRADKPDDKTYIGLKICQLLSNWGRLRQAHNTADDLLHWLETYQDDERYAHCMYLAFSNYAEIEESLGLFEFAEDYADKAEYIGKHLDGDVMEKYVTFYEPNQLSPLWKGRIQWLEQLENAAEAGRMDDAVQLYIRGRRWFLQNNLNTAQLDYAISNVYAALKNFKNYYITLKRAYNGMERWKRNTLDKAMVSNSLSLLCAAHGMTDEARDWMKRGIADVNELYLDAQEYFLFEVGLYEHIIQMTKDLGWSDEAEIWQKMYDSCDEKAVGVMYDETGISPDEDPAKLMNEKMDKMIQELKDDISISPEMNEFIKSINPGLDIMSILDGIQPEKDDE